MNKQTLRNILLLVGNLGLLLAMIIDFNWYYVIPLNIIWIADAIKTLYKDDFR